ncbi:MAG TPA: DMT family transporter [Dongiaceae bacterium]|jgi:drug/metabolite transporter (DMT)-like permease|nr:DMT family transporter [Dongiaceae bacterium]
MTRDPVSRAQQNLRLLDWLLLGILAFLWGASFLLGKIAVGEVSSYGIALARVASAALVLTVFGLYRGIFALITPRLAGELLLLGLFNNAVPFCLIFSAQKHIGSGLASVLNATVPFFSALLGHFLTHTERLTLRRLAGVLIGIAGVVVLIGPAAFSGGLSLLSDLMILGAAFSYACAAQYARRFRALPPLLSTVGQVISASIILLPVWLALERPWQHVSLPPWPIIAILLALGLFCTALAYILYFTLIRRAGATNATLVVFLVPVFALIASNLLLAEPIHLSEVWGMLGIFLGLAVIDGRPFRWVLNRAENFL